MPRDGIRWTNASVLALAGEQDPIAVIERLAREKILEAMDAGYAGPPFDPIRLAESMQIAVEPNSSIAEARTISLGNKLKIQFNPSQSKQRIRFSIAHEIAHCLFPDVGDQVRHRGGTILHDDWQLEVLCNIAAAEFVMPLGSLPTRAITPSIENLMIERHGFDVSAEAYLIRVAKTTDDPLLMFCAAPQPLTGSPNSYVVNYTVPSRSWPLVPTFKGFGAGSCAFECSAIGYTASRNETIDSFGSVEVECVGISAFPSGLFPRVAGLIRTARRPEPRDRITFLHGNVLDPRGKGPRVICQLVNNRAKVWGGGIASQSALKFPQAHESYKTWFAGYSRDDRLGSVHFGEAGDELYLASIVAQEGFGKSDSPRIRYTALEAGLEKVLTFAEQRRATIHMPRVGTGAAGGNWQVVEEILRSLLKTDSPEVYVYDLPPRRRQTQPSLFDG